MFKTSDFIRQHAVSIDYHIGESWTILSKIEQSIKKKIEAVGTPLKDWDISINYGIKTGLNEAFIISKEKRDELIKADPKSAEIIRPILRGRDIKKHSYEFAELYVITAYKGIHKIIQETYPAVYSHLKKFETKLRQRGQVEGKIDKPGSNQHHWTELDNNISLEKLDDFSRLKIIYPNMTKYLPFYLDKDEYLTNQKAFIITGENLGSLVAFCNSSLFKFAYSDNFPELQGGTRELSKVFFEKLIISKTSDSENAYFQKSIEKIQENTFLNKDTTKLEEDLDNSIFELYSLNSTEIELIKGSLQQ